jgi:hypothetical protein
MEALYAVLLSWAVTLSGYPAPKEEPVVVYATHAYFVENACGGKECRVYGWYAGGRNIYIDQELDPNASLLASSVIVHEMVHYLQGLSRNGGAPAHGSAYRDRPTCADAIADEREAYGVQKEYLLRYGVFQPVGMSMLSVGCDRDAAQPAPVP